MKLGYFAVFGRPLAIAAGAALIGAAPVLASPSGEKGAGPGHHCAAMGRMMSRISVTGEGESRVAPDLAVIDLGVTSQAQTAAEASALNAEAQSSVIDALKQAGLDEADIQTSQLNLGPIMQHGEDEPPKVTGYRASNSVTVRVTELDRTGEILDAIVAAGSNQINGIRFSREDSAEAEDEALAAAVENARRKAEVMARAADLTLGPVIAMSDMVQSGGPQPMMMRAEMASDASTPVQPGELSVSAQVQVSYTLNGDGPGDACAAPARGEDANGEGTDTTGPGDVLEGEAPAEADSMEPGNTEQ